MDEISNKTLATLLVVAIVISLAGTFFAMRGVSQVTNYVSGAATSDSGYTKLNITAKTSIILNYDTVSFGGGYRNETCIVNDLSGDINYILNLTSDDATAPTCWVVDDGSGPGTGTYAPQDLQVENDGNVEVDVKVNATAYDANTNGDTWAMGFFESCSGKKANSGTGTPLYMFTGENEESGSCSTGNGNLATETNFDGTLQTLCSNFSFIDTKDLMNVSIKLGVPAGPTGACTDTIDFEATEI